MDVSLDADGSIDRGSGFYGACGALSASGVGQKENNGDRVRYRCRHRSRCAAADCLEPDRFRCCAPLPEIIR